MDDVAVWDVMVDAANNGCVLTSEGVRLAIIAKDAELKRLREAVTYADKFIEDQAAFYKRGNTWDRGNDPMYDISVAALAELRRRAKEG